MVLSSKYARLDNRTRGRDSRAVLSIQTAYHMAVEIKRTLGRMVHEGMLVTSFGAWRRSQCRMSSISDATDRMSRDPQAGREEYRRLDLTAAFRLFSLDLIRHHQALPSPLEVFHLRHHSNGLRRLVHIRRRSLLKYSQHSLFVGINKILGAGADMYNS